MQDDDEARLAKPYLGGTISTKVDRSRWSTDEEVQPKQFTNGRIGVAVIGAQPGMVGL
ncbi:MAG: hypothetical protein JO354_08770 [Verrucomicrobia bacterium]|nr:hypothetical protein [Verrucomicrobiota bacterium]